jgi:hypothetical protein
LLPPPGFTPLVKCDQAWLTNYPWRGKISRPRGAKAAGLRFEKKAKEFLREKYNERILLGPWFYVLDGVRRRYCQPDALVFDREPTQRSEVVTIVEIKIAWSALAYWQLRHLYEPVIRAMYGPRETRLICLARSADPLVATPEAPTLLDSLDATLEEGKVGIYLWRG